MIQSELAYNVNGEPFDVPEKVTGWRGKLLRGGRGAPGVAYGRDGRPLTLGVDATLDDLREAVDVSGRFRLDPIDDDGKVVEGVPAAYVQVTIPERNAATSELSALTGLTSVDHALREIVRANLELARCNTELAKTVVNRQPEVMASTAEILRAADGAGLPRRAPLADWDSEDEDGDDNADIAQSDSPLGAIMNQLAPLVQLGSAYLGSKLGMPGAAAPKPTRAPSGGTTAPPTPTSDETSSDADTTLESPTPERAPVADIGNHVMQIQKQLTADERRFVEGAIALLTISEVGQWQQQLSRMSVAEAVAGIRAEIARSAKPGKPTSTATPAAQTQEKVS
ncbi:MAG: hypothetical protein H0T46_22870 [Deltaproteobacteria bacterium]|nr:hypothetical protein [Deltaproteobacteria bacterium]